MEGVHTIDLPALFVEWWHGGGARGVHRKKNSRIEDDLVLIFKNNDIKHTYSQGFMIVRLRIG
jgi:hypothetical protein